jgi:xanthine dehydrogenase accessory factor
VSERVNAAAAARAQLAALEGGPAVCVVLAVDSGRRLLCYTDRTEGSLGDSELDAAASETAREALRTGERFLRRLDFPGSPPLFFDPVSAPDRLVVVGAGHIGVPLANLGAQLGFEVTVLDDRQEFAAAERFAENVRVLRCHFEGDPFVDVTIDERTYVALVTRGHAWDFDCLRILLDRALVPRYIGMIGSRRRVRAALGALLDAGVPHERLALIHAPIGLDLGAETPAEIAVSIAAELVGVRRGGSARPLTEREQVLERLLPETDRTAR